MRVSITNNTIATGVQSGDIGINMNINGPSAFTACATITGNVVTLGSASLVNGINLTAASGTLNIDDFSNNIADDVVMSGAVNLVLVGTCGQ